MATSLKQFILTLHDYGFEEAGGALGRNGIALGDWQYGPDKTVKGFNLTYPNDNSSIYVKELLTLLSILDIPVNYETHRHNHIIDIYQHNTIIKNRLYNSFVGA